MKCQNCGHQNDADAEFCEKCGTKLKETSGMLTSTKMLIVVMIVLVAGLGLVSGMMLMKNQNNPTGNTAVNNTTADVSDSPSQTTQSGSSYKTFSNGIIYFQYPSSWDVLPNSANTMAIVGFSSYPDFSVYNESKYGHKSLAEYVSTSKSGMTKDGYTILSEQSRTVNGLPAYEIIYQGQTITQQMVLVEKSTGAQYFALVGVDKIDHFEKERPTFNQIINSFKFLS